MIDPEFHEVEQLRGRLSDLIQRAGLADELKEVASEALEELAVIIEELQSQNNELDISRRDLTVERKRYRDLFDEVPDGYLVTTNEGIIEEANLTACGLLERRTHEIIGKPLGTFVEPADRSAYYRQLVRIRTSGAGEHVTVNLRILDGQPIPVSVSATIGDTSTAAQGGIRWLIHDRRDDIATEDLRVSEERLRALFDTAQVGVVLGNSRGEVLFTNQYADRFFARDDGGNGWSDWILAAHPDDAADVEDLVRSAFTGQQAASLRHRVTHVDGTARWVDHSVAPFHNGQRAVTGFVSTFVDVTAEQAAIVGLRESHDFTSALLDTIGALVVVTDASGTILRFNKTCESVCGFRADDMIGQPLIDTLVPVEQRAETWRVFDELARPATNSFENDWHTADGGLRRIAWNNTNLVDPSGEVIAIIGTGIDVTEEHVMRARLAQADRLESIGRLTAGIAHDLNNTLTAVRIRLERLADRDLDSQSSADVEAASATIERTQSLIADLVSFSGRHDLVPEPVDVNIAVARMVEILGDLVQDDVEIRAYPTDDDTTAFIHPARLDQILTNLVMNANDAMPGGGVLTMKTKLETVSANSSASVIDLDPGTYVKLSVADTGTGIDPDHVTQIFDPYFTTKPPGRGTGLGLATTYGTLAQIGGGVVASSRHGHGTEFTVWLPHHPTGVADRASQPSPPRTTKGVALVVDDDVKVVRKLTKALRDIGYSTLQANDGQEALALAEGQIDLLVTDVQLPGISGPEVAELLQRDRPNLRTVFVSGATPLQLATVLPEGAALVAKPVTNAEFVAAIGETPSTYNAESCHTVPERDAPQAGDGAGHGSHAIRASGGWTDRGQVWSGD